VAPRHHGPMITTTEDTIGHRYEQWFSAVMARDTAALAALLDDTFVYTDIFGVVRHKAAYLGLVERIPAGGITMRMEHLNVHRSGTVVVVTGRYRVVGSTADGTNLSSHTQFSALWTDETGSSRCLAHHATRRRDPSG
jgi:ketosteroid isomerase-like protein